MSNLSGYDSEAVGFDSVPPARKVCAAISTQTTEFAESGMESQTNLSKDVGCTATAEDIQVTPVQEYLAGLNEFLRKVVPGVLEQLAQNDQETLYSSDSDDGEVSRAVLRHELKARGSLGCGDHQSSVLAVAWSTTNTLAVSIGSGQHEDWCQGPGLIQIYNFKPRGDNIQPLDVEERECVTVLRYHPTLAGLLAYGTASGELVVRQSSETLNQSVGSARVSCLRWADASLANVYLTLLVRSRGQRRCASDQVLFSSSSDGAINVWRVNVDQRTFENMVRYEPGLGRKSRPDITSFDIPSTHPLRPFGERNPEVFVVATKSGEIYVCEIREQLDAVVDPLSEVLEGHNTCVLDVAFSQQKPGLFVSLSTDSELRLHRAGQTSPLRIFCLDVVASCMSWLGSSPCVLLGLTDSSEEGLRVYNVSNGKFVPVEGFLGSLCVTCVDVQQSGCYRIAAGDAGNTLRIWELPMLRDKCVWDYDL